MNAVIASLLMLAVAVPWTARAEVKLGNEVLADGHFKVLQGKRVGLLTNPSGVNRHLDSTIDVLRAAPGVKLVALFGPEHGVYGDVSGGRQSAPAALMPARGCRRIRFTARRSSRRPRCSAGLDALVYDLQDTGCRSYTFVSTMGVAMEACGRGRRRIRRARPAQPARRRTHRGADARRRSSAPSSATGTCLTSMA